MTKHPRHVDFQVQQKLWLYNPRRVIERTPKLESDWEGSYKIVKKMMSFSASRRHQNTKRRSFILIDGRPTTIGNFFCSTHGNFEPWFFSVSHRANAKTRTKVKSHGMPTLHLCQELPIRLYPPMMT